MSSSSVTREVAGFHDKTSWLFRRFWSPTHKHFGYYDEHARTHKRSLVRLLEVLLELAETTPGMCVLDAGCGFGGTVHWLADQHIVGFGVSLSEEDVRQASRIAPGRIFLEDYAHTSFPAEGFDQVWAIESFCHSNDKAAFFREAWRLLKPGGKVVVADYLPSVEYHPDLQLWMDAWVMPKLVTPSQMYDLVVENGFKKIYLCDHTDQVRPSARRMYWSLKLVAPIHPVIARLVPGADLYRKGTFAMLRAFSYQWRYGILVAEKPVPGA